MTGNSASALLSRSLGTVVIESALSILLAIGTIAGNSLVLLAVYRSPRLRKVHNAYVVCLACSDLLMGILSCPVFILVLITGRLPGGEPLCWFLATIPFYSAVVSIHTMAVISIQRYYKVVKRNQHDSMFSRRRVAASVCLIWSVAAVVILTLTMISRSVHFHEEFPICTIDMDIITFVSVYLSFGAVLPYATMFWFYLKIWRFIKAHNSHMGTSSVNHDEIKVTKLLCSVLGAFALCFVPHLVCMACLHLGIKLPRGVAATSQLVVAASNTVNPILYGVMHREFREEFLKITCFWRKSGNCRSLEVVPGTDPKAAFKTSTNLTNTRS